MSMSYKVDTRVENFYKMLL